MRGDFVAVVGAGPAGLIAAERLAAKGLKVVVFEAMASPGRKFLMAGRGGLNLTHSEPMPALLSRYDKEVPPALSGAITVFPPTALVEWANALGQETFIGSSGRIFPKAMKASPLLRAWLRRLQDLGVEIRTRHRWTGWDAAGALAFEAEHGGVSTFLPSATLLAVGGASWPRLGSDGRWVDTLSAAGIAIAPIEPANAGLRMAWSAYLRERFAGEALKRIAVTFDGVTRRGEAVITRDGLEGGVVYAFTPAIRSALVEGAAPVIDLDLRPDISEDDLARRFADADKKQSAANVLRKSGGLSKAAIALLREGEAGPLPTDARERARRIKRLTLRSSGISGLERAISSAGGVRFGAIDSGFMLTARPGVFVAGEMLDWEAPTGGYLLQACFATGVAAAAGIGRWLARTAQERQKAAAGEV